MKYRLEITDKKYLALKESVLKIVILVGLVATLIASVSNMLIGKRVDLSVQVHLFGFLLLLFLLIFYQKIDKAVVTYIALGYFCFIYTPFGWYDDSINDAMLYVPYVFFLLISILLDGKLYRMFTCMYFIEILLLVLFAHSALLEPDEPYVITAFSYVVLLSILVFVTAIYKKQYMLFVRATNHSAITDMLTGLYNHRYLTDMLADMEKELSTRPGADWAIAVIDLDDFKQINDRYGHTAGDAVLRELGLLLSEVFKEHTVGRYGGDEFVAVFRKIPFSRCSEICETLMERLQSQLFTEQQIKVRLSIGLCSSRQIQGENLLKKADQLMYEAKKSKNTLRYRDEPS